MRQAVNWPQNSRENKLLAELLLIRHGQAAFGASGAQGYDQLTDLGRAQAGCLGRWLKEADWAPDRVVTGTLDRQRQTLEEIQRGLGTQLEAEEHPGWNEYDFHDLLSCSHGGQIPDDIRADRKTHFRALRETLKQWQADDLQGPKESWSAFCARVGDARQQAVTPVANRILVISSGGVIGQSVSACLGTSAEQMIALNLQVRNSSLTRFMVTRSSWFLNEFNAIPHLSTRETAALMSYS